MLSALPTRALLLAVALVLTGCADADADPEPETVGGSVEGDVSVRSNETADAAAPALVADVDTTGPAVVEVAGESVPARAVVTDIVSGDRSCTITLRQDGGAAVTVQADYSVCDSDAIVDRRVQIAYEPTEVMAASCGSDPDCLETETVPLAVVAEPIGG